MVKLSNKMLDLIKDDIVSTLYNSHESMFATEIAFEIRRDKEFVKKLLLELKKLGLVDEIKKNRKGYEYKERRRWRLKPHVISAYEA
jgi:predicted transcriptional regulator